MQHEVRRASFHLVKYCLVTLVVEGEQLVHWPYMVRVDYSMFFFLKDQQNKISLIKKEGLVS